MSGRTRPSSKKKRLATAGVVEQKIADEVTPALKQPARRAPAIVRQGRAKPPPIPPGALKKARPASFDTASTVVVSGPIPIEAMPALDSVPTVMMTSKPIPAEAVARSAPRVTAAIVPRRLKAPTANPLAGIDDNALDAFVDGSISESTNVGLGNDDTTLH